MTETDISFIDLLKRAWELLRLDKLIVAPSIMLFLVLNVIEPYLTTDSVSDTQFSADQLTLLLPIWLINLFFVGFVVAMAKSLIFKKEILIPESMQLLLSRYVSLIISGFLAFLPMLILLLSSKFLLPMIAIVPFIEKLVAVVMNISTLMVMVITMFVLTFLPMVVIYQKKNQPLMALLSSLKLVKTYPRYVILLVALTSVIKLVSFFMSQFFAGIPLLGEALFIALFQGIGHAISSLVVILFYFSVTQKRVVLTSSRK